MSHPIKLAVAMTSASVTHTPSRVIPEAVHIFINILVQVVFEHRGDGSAHVLYDSISDDAMVL